VTEHSAPQPAPQQPAGLGLNQDIRVCLFDMDGVLTKTATVHAAAWKQTFDALLRRLDARDSRPFEPFDDVKDYEKYVDGKPRADGVRSFLTARGIELPEGSPDDPPTAETVQGVGNAKNDAFNEQLAKDGVDALATLQETVPDVMLLDIEMPRMDGYELATHMRNDERFKKIPIIMITSRTGEKHRNRAMEIGVDRYLGKPYQEAELLENIQELVGSFNPQSTSW